MIIAIIILAVLLFVLLFRPQRALVGAKPDVQQRRRDDSDGFIHGETPGGPWHGGPLHDDDATEPGGGDFGGGGASGDWGDEGSSD